MKKLIKKADEMEMAINYKAMRLSWVVLVVALVIWDCIEIAQGNTGSPVILLVALQGVVFWGSKVYYTNKITAAGDDDEK